MELQKMELKKIQTFLNSKHGTLKVNDKGKTDTSYVEFDMTARQIVAKPDERIFLCVSSVSFPNSIYNVNDNNNVLKYSVDYGPIGGSTTEYDNLSYTCYLTNGTYDSTTFPTMVASVIDNKTNKVNNVSLVDSGGYWVLEFDKDSPDNENYETTHFRFEQGTTCDILLGLEEYNTVIHSPYTFTKMYDISYTKNIFIASNELLNSNIDSKDKFNGMSNILASVQLTSNYGSIIYWNNVIEVALQGDAVRSFGIQILDDDKRLVSLNKFDWLIEIDFRIVHKENKDIEKDLFRLDINENKRKRYFNDEEDYLSQNNRRVMR